MREKPQGPRNRDARVLLAKRPGGGVAGVGELARLGGVRGLGQQPDVERGEIRLRHIDFAAHLDDRGRTVRQALRDVRDRQDVGGHVLADLAVAAGQRLDQTATLVAQRAGQAVDLGFRGQRDGFVVGQPQEAADARDEILDLLVGERIVQAHHRARVRDLGERPGGGRADAVGRRIGADQVGKRRLHRAVAADQRIVCGIGQFGGVVAMVFGIGLRDSFGQRRQFGGGVVGIGGQRGHSLRLPEAWLSGQAPFVPVMPGSSRHPGPQSHR